MIRFLLLLCFVVSISISAQFENAEMKSLIENEMKIFSKKLDVNVNPNTLNYDLKYQRIELILDPAVNFIDGTITSHFNPKQNLSSIYFDVSQQLKISEVKYKGQNLNFSQLTTDEVKIDFPTQLNANVLDSISIKYSGVPASRNSFTTSFQNGVPVLYTLSEPFGAKDWWITKQSLNDKIEKLAIKITAPAQYNVASNGNLISEKILNDGRKLTYWQTNYPIPAYLFALGITNYTKLNDTIGSTSFPFVNYLYPTTATNPDVLSNINWTKICMKTFEEYFGEYPYKNEKYGHMQFGWGGGMEHATMSSMGSFSHQLIAHELAHQWFGDKITCGAWNDIWLNEGFATFGEHLVYEKLLMTPTEFQNYLTNRKNFITSLPDGSTYVTDFTNFNAIFSSRLSYAKGGYILRMIKWILGDNVFYKSLKDYQSRPNLEYNYAKSEDFNASLKQSTGKDFTEFFKDWLYGQGYPTYDIKWKQNADKNIVFLVNQTQSHSSVGFFEMPLPIKLIGKNGEIAFVKLENTENGQEFSVPSSFEVSSVQFNYENQILEKNSTVTNDNFLFFHSEIKEIKIVDNPVKSSFQITGILQPEPFEIYFSDGKLIKKSIYQPETSIDFSGYGKGMYILKIKNQTIKFLKH